MTLKREHPGSLRQGTLKRTVCAPYRPAQGVQDSANLTGGMGTGRAGTPPPEAGGARATGTRPLSENGDVIVMDWSNEYFKEIHDKHEELRLSKEEALRGTAVYADEELNAFLIYFDPESASIRDQDDVIERALAAIRQAPDSDILVKGHADRHGPAFRNDNLSSERATNVAKLLRQHGVAWSRIECAYYGSRDPRPAAIINRKADQMNRRVQIVIKR